MGRRAKHFYWWVPDLSDQRDYRYSAIHRRKAVLPKTVDLRLFFSVVENQGELGSGTAKIQPMAYGVRLAH